MCDWLSEPTKMALVLVILSVFGLVGGSFSAGGITFNLNTGKGKVNFFLMLIGAAGLFIIVFDFLYFLNK